MRFFMRLFIIAILSLNALAYAQMPSGLFDEGVVVAPLTEIERADLRQYAESSKARLTEALEEARGKTFKEANEIYANAIQEVVQWSYVEKRRAELLMRMALNQALELTTGIPDKQQHGVLAGIQNRNLITVVLEDSIKLSLKYIVEDERALEAGSLATLPYLLFSAERLNSAREWGAAITELPLQYRYWVTVLRQWMAVATYEGQPHRAAIAPELLRVDAILKRKSPTFEAALKGRVRVLRGEVRKLLKSLNELLRIEQGRDESLVIEPTASAEMKSNDSGSSNSLLDRKLNSFRLEVGVGYGLTGLSENEGATTYYGRAEKLFELDPETQTQTQMQVGPLLKLAGRHDKYDDNSQFTDRTSLSAELSIVSARNLIDRGGSGMGAELNVFTPSYKYDRDGFKKDQRIGITVMNGRIGTAAAFKRAGGVVAEANLSLIHGGFAVGDENTYLGSDKKFYTLADSLTIGTAEVTLGYCGSRGEKKDIVRRYSPNAICLTDTASIAPTFYSGGDGDAEFTQTTFQNDVNLDLTRLGLGYQIGNEKVTDDYAGANVDRSVWRHMLYLRGTL